MHVALQGNDGQMKLRRYSAGENLFEASVWRWRFCALNSLDAPLWWRKQRMPFVFVFGDRAEIYLEKNAK